MRPQSSGKIQEQWPGRTNVPLCREVVSRLGDPQLGKERGKVDWRVRVSKWEVCFRRSSEGSCGGSGHGW